MPSFPIVDSHVHLYDPTFLTYGWLKSVPKIDRRYDLGDFDRCRGPVQVDKIVFAEVAVDRGLHFAEAAWVQDLADKDSRLAGMIAHAPMEKGTAVAADLDRLAENRILRGIRRLIEVESNYAFCLQPDFIEALNLLPARKLTFDICVKHWGVVFAIELARRCRARRLVLFHHDPTHDDDWICGTVSRIQREAGPHLQVIGAQERMRLSSFACRPAVEPCG